MTNSDDVAQVVLRERQARDRGWWEQMRECIHPQAGIRLSWFRGTGHDFVAESEKMAGSGLKSTHRLSPPVTSVHDTRAVVEMPAGIEFRDVVGGAEADLTAYTRLVYRVENLDGRWQVVALDCIYERDSLVPTTPGDVPRLDREKLAALRAPFRFLGYFLMERGYQVGTDLYADDRPDEVAELYSSAFAWARAAGDER